MLKCDQPEKPRKVYTIPKQSKKRLAAMADGSYKPKERKPIKVNPDAKIKPRSDKRAKQEREYNQLRAQYLKEHPSCQARVMCLGLPATEVHHKAGRIGDKLTDVKDFIGLCSACHSWAELNVTQAKALGISKDRLTNQ